MGREAYLARVVLGRSAFEAPLRDENGNFILGGQAGVHDDISATQEWNDRGHPVSQTSDKRAKKLRNAQNEVLEACGVIVYKDAAKRRKQAAKEVPKEEQIKIVVEENRIGLTLTVLDRLCGSILTWWVSRMRRRLITFDTAGHSLSQIIQQDFNATPLSLFFGGFVAGVFAWNARFVRQGDEIRPWACMNYLDYDLSEPSNARSPKAWEWIGRKISMLSELPLELVSTLQTLGFAVIPKAWQGPQEVVNNQGSLLSLLADITAVSQVHTVIIRYLVHDYLYHQVSWRIYGLLRQTLPRPYRAGKSAIQAGRFDSFAYDSFESRFGRALSKHSDQRFYGPLNFWSALTVAFPWLRRIFGSSVDRNIFKRSTLNHCAWLETRHTETRSREVARADNIINTLSALGIDLEEDFYVDVDEWAGEIDSQDEEAIEDVEEVLIIRSDHRIPQNEDNEVADFLTSDNGPHTPLSGSQHIPSPSPQLNDLPPLTRFDPPLLSPPSTPPNLTPIDVPTPIVPLTPEPGIRRAQSLIEAQTEAQAQTQTVQSPSATHTTPRPVRRPTETNEHDLNEAIQMAIANANKEIEKQKKKTKKKEKDKREHRVTSLSTFAADSLAWHLCFILTDVILLPIDMIYYRGVASWYTRLTGDVPAVAGLGMIRSGRGIMSLDWGLARSVVLTFGIELLIRGALWRVGSGVALYYARMGMWGKF